MNSHVILAFVLLLLPELVKYAKAAQGDMPNGKEFHVMCSLISLARSDLTKLNVAELSTTDVSEIEQLNMSASVASWYNAFDDEVKDAQPDKAESICSKIMAHDKENCKTLYTKWQATKAAFVAASKTNEKLKLKRGPQETVADRRIQKQLALIGERANTIYSDYVKNIKPSLADGAPDIKADLETALYGAGASAKDGSEAATITHSGSREANCAVPEAGKSLIGDLICLCAPDSTTTNVKLCGHTVATHTQAWGGSFVPKTAWDTLAPKCKPFEGKLTAIEITAALAAFRAALKSDKQADPGTVILGHPHTTGKCASAAKVACVDYTKAMTQWPSEPNNEIKWYKSLAQAASKLLSRAQQAAKQEKTATELQHLKLSAWQLYEAMKIENLPTAPVLTPKGNKEPTAEETKACEKYNGNQKECPQDSCTYDKTKEECTPKAGTESAAAGTGDKAGAAGANSETEKCTNKKTEGDCKDGCKWDGEECKDSSILANKQFALTVVSAAFVALLF
uniref:Variable surface glycoprotein n=1 Tax=Trypanosoma evansi TaxID=5697 RepID=Q968M3_TRYEV|nr:variable surface glycoprotein [Trypanosoma evansi]